jgi:cellobiose epimerase
MFIRLSAFIVVLSLAISCKKQPRENSRTSLAEQIDKSIQTELLNKWYPLVIDEEFGGYITTFTFDFKPTGPQDKMIVTQARHVWTSSKAFMDYGGQEVYKKVADHGLNFLKDVMWDKTHGGFFQLTDRQGNVKAYQKTEYGNYLEI